MEISNDSQLNSIFQDFHTACSIYDTIHSSLLEMSYLLRHTPTEKKTLQQAVNQMFLQNLTKECFERLESAIERYNAYKKGLPNVTTNEKSSFNTP